MGRSCHEASCEFPRLAMTNSYQLNDLKLTAIVLQDSLESVGSGKRVFLFPVSHGFPSNAWCSMACEFINLVSSCLHVAFPRFSAFVLTLLFWWSDFELV